jgi:hypothetical protein
MEDNFILPVTYKGKEYELSSRFVRLGYIYQFHVVVEEHTLIFERDEENSFRVIGNNNDSKTDIGLLQVIVERLNTL